MSENKITIYIDGREYKVDDNQSILEACKSCGYYIPSLCNWRDHACSVASCRVCLVKVEGERRLVPSCAYDVRDGLHIAINDPDAIMARRTSVELLLSNHSFDCQACRKNGNCELLDVSKQVGARPERYVGEKTKVTLDDLSNGLVRDTSKCILCGRCIEACKRVHGIGVLGFENRGFNTIVSPAQNRSFVNTPCIQCGQCTLVCPTGALMEKCSIPELDKAFQEKKTVIAFVAPAVRAAIAEEFGYKIGTNGTGKLAAALHRLGFYRVFDTNYSADVTIMEEANEFVKRFSTHAPKPMITSCSPGWINYIELNYPELLSHLSTCKSPQQMMGALIKSYYAEKKGLDRSKIFTVSIMPCTAKKDELKREQLNVDGIRDVDCSLTTRELADLIRRSGIVFNRLPDEDFDRDFIGENTGAGVIFGVTGGVMEAALRTAYHILTNEELEPCEFTPVRGLEGIKEASVEIAGIKVNIAVCSGMKNAKIIMDQIKDGTCKYDFLEVMGCPGGCINGGGQPYVFPAMLPNEDPDIWNTYREKRAAVLYEEDKNKPIRRSHLNPDVQKLYSDYLFTPGSKKAEELLHTTYNQNRVKFPEISEDNSNKTK